MIVAARDIVSWEQLEGLVAQLAEQVRGNRVLIVDEVWDTGMTIHAVIDRVKLAGGVPTTAVLH